MIPRGFMEIRAIEHPPIVAREYMARGAVVKYLESRPLEIAGMHGAIDYLMVHEFKARGGNGLSFRLAGTPDLNAKMWAVRPGWTLWVQYLGIDQFQPLLPSGDSYTEHRWHIGGVSEVPSLRQLMRDMEADHRVLDHGIAIEAGLFSPAELGYLAIADEAIALVPADTEVWKDEGRPTLPAAETFKLKPHRRKSLLTASRDLSDEDLELQPIDRAALPLHALVRTLLKGGAKPRELFEKQMCEAGFTTAQQVRAMESLGVVARFRGGEQLLELPGPSKKRRSPSAVATNALPANAEVRRLAPLGEIARIEAPASSEVRGSAVLVPEARGTATLIQEAVALEWGVTVEAMHSKTRAQTIVAPRQVAMHFMREFLQLPFQAIGVVFGGTDYTTVMHSVDRVASKMAADPFFAQRVTKLRDALAGTLGTSIAAVNDTH